MDSALTTGSVKLCGDGPRILCSLLEWNVTSLSHWNTTKITCLHCQLREYHVIVCDELGRNGNQQSYIKLNAGFERGCIVVHRWYLYPPWLRCDLSIQTRLCVGRCERSCFEIYFFFKGAWRCNLCISCCIWLVAAECESLSVVTGQLTCLPEFSWDQHGIQLTEATCSGKIPFTHISLCSGFHYRALQ